MVCLKTGAKIPQITTDYTFVAPHTL